MPSSITAICASTAFLVNAGCVCYRNDSMNGCLVIHGLTGSPATVASLRDALAAAGFRVAVPCLPGHGGTVSELGCVTWRDWYGEVRNAFSQLKQETEHVFCAGISLGSLLCMKLALDEGWGVRAMALMATALRLSTLDSLALKLVRYSPLRWIIRNIRKDLGRSIADPEGRARYSELSLPMIPAKAVYEVADLQRELLPNLSRITNPVLLLHGGCDSVAPPCNVELMKKSISSDVVESIILPRSKHVITMDFEKDVAARAASDFFKRFA